MDQSTHGTSALSRYHFALCASLLTACLIALPAARAQSASGLPTLAEARQVNARTIGIVFHYEDIYRRLVTDIGKAFDSSASDSEPAMRVVPIIGVNHAQTMLDILYMQGVDLGIVHADVFEYLARSQRNARVYDRINALVELYSEKIAIIARDDNQSLEDLAGKKVNFRTLGKGSDVTGTVLFGTLGIDVIKTRFDKLEALEKVKSGEIDAMIYLIEEPVDEFLALSRQDNVRLIPLPQSEELLGRYNESELTAADFPGLVDDDSPVVSLGVPVIIAAYNWPASEAYRYGKSRRFIENFISNLDTLKQGDNDNIWQDVSLEKDIPGVVRLALVDIVLEQQAAERERLIAENAAATTARLKAQREQVARDLAARLNESIANTSDPEELETLLEQMQSLLQNSRP